MNAPKNIDAKDQLAIELLCFNLPIIIIGIWMITSPVAEDHLSVEKGSIYFMKEIWGFQTGISIFIFSLFLIITTLVKFKKSDVPKRTDNNYRVFQVSSSVLIHGLILYAIIISQNFLAESGFISSAFAYEDKGTIDLVFITVIIALSIIAFVFKLRCGIKGPKFQ